VSQRRIDTGAVSGGFTAVPTGLQEGDLVITEGLNKVRPGVTVDAVPASDG
jgi:membrane fusion protein (multidrug efflux system)